MVDAHSEGQETGKGGEEDVGAKEQLQKNGMGGGR